MDDTIPLVLNVYATIFRSGDWDGYIEACVRIWCLFARFKRRNYNKAPLFFLSDVWYWESINHPILEILKKHLVSFSDYLDDKHGKRIHLNNFQERLALSIVFDTIMCFGIHSFHQQDILTVKKI